jgi:phospholipase/lecithinase/hemolysin
MNPEDVVKNIEDAIVTLYRLGARHVMVLDLLNLGKIPANAGNEEQAAALSSAHNFLLYGMLEGLQTRFPSLHLVPVKLDLAFETLPVTMNTVVPALEVYGAAPGMSGCLFLNPATCQDVPTSVFNANLNFLFWDIVHPTTEAHRYLADYMYTELVNSYD